MQQIPRADPGTGAFPVVLQRPGCALLKHSVGGEHVNGGEQPLPVRTSIRVVGPATVDLHQSCHVVGEFLKGQRLPDAGLQATGGVQEQDQLTARRWCRRG